MTTEVEKLSQAAVDEAVTLGQYIAEDPERLKAWLDAYSQDDAVRKTCEAIEAIGVGLALAHVKSGLVTLIMQMIVESAWTADAYIRKAKEGRE